MEPNRAGDDPPAAAMADLAGEAAMALSGLSALIGPSSGTQGVFAFQNATSSLEALASMDLTELKEVSAAPNPHSDANVILSASAALSLETRSASTPSEEGGDIGDMDDDIAGLLNLTQAAANMRPVKRISSDRGLKASSGAKAKPKKELRVKPKPVAPKAKALKPAKLVRGAKTKPLSVRRAGEVGSKSEKESVREVEVGAESDGEVYAHLEASEFEALFETMVREAESNARDIRKSKATSSEVYGEVTPVFVEQLCETLELKASDVFFDLGSGTGNVVCQVASQVGCRCYGVEIRSDLHAIAERVYEGVKREMHRRGRKMGQINFTNADALTQPMLLVDTTVVFLNNINFPESMQGPLEHFFTETLPHGSRLVTTKEMFPRIGSSSHEKRSSRSFSTLFKHPCEVVEAAAGTVAWTSDPVSYFIYTVDREAWAAVTYAINRPSHIMTDSLRGSSNALAKQEKVSPRPKKASSSSSSSSPLPSGAPNGPLSPSKGSTSSPPYSLQSPFQNPHARFCLQPDPSYPIAVKSFVSSLHERDIGNPIISSISSISSVPAALSPNPLEAASSSAMETEPAGESEENSNSSSSTYSTSADYYPGSEVSLVLESYQSMRSGTTSEYCSNRSMLSALVGSELANPGISVESVLSRLEAHHALSSRSHEFQMAHKQELGDLYHSEEADRHTALEILSVDRRMRMEAKRARQERIAKLTEIAALSINAKQLDDAWQRDWQSTDQLRKQLADREEKLEFLAKQRHTAIQQLGQLIEDETEESLNYSDPNNLLRRKPLAIDGMSALNATAIDSVPAADSLVLAPTSFADISLQSIKDFLSTGAQFMEANGIDMPGPKKNGGRIAKIDRRFGPRPKKPTISSTNSLAASTSSNLKQGSLVDREEDTTSVSAAFPESSASPHSPGSNYDGNGDFGSISMAVSARRAAQSMKMDVDGEVEMSLDSGLVGPHSPLSKRKDGLVSNHASFVDANGPLVSMGDYLRASRPRRVVAMTAPPPNEPVRRVKKPGQKSLDRKQLKVSLMNSLLSSPDGKLSIVELRQACKDLPPFRDLREKQIERKVWDALSKAQDQFKHALPTPAERKAHAMGAGKAGLWSLNPRWRPNHPNDRDISSDESDDDDDGTQDDDADFDENDLPPVVYKSSLNKKRARTDSSSDSPNASKPIPSPDWDEEGSPPSSKKIASADSFPAPEAPNDPNSAVHSLAFLASAMESLSEDV